MGYFYYILYAGTSIVYTHSWREVLEEMRLAVAIRPGVWSK